MSELEPTIHIPTPEEMRRQDGSFLSGYFISYKEHAPEEFGSVCAKHIGILGQLSGQPKADFFHMRHFLKQADEEALREKMAKADNDAAQWNILYDERVKAEHQTYLQEEQQIAKFGKELIALGLGRIATHPFVQAREHGKAASFLGKHNDEVVHFNLAGDPESLKRLVIELPQTPRSFDYEELGKPGRKDRNSRYNLKRQVEGGKQLVKTGEVLEFYEIGDNSAYPYRKEIIDDAMATVDSFAALGKDDSFDRRRELPLAIDAEDSRIMVASSEIVELIEMVKTAGPVT